MKLTTTKKQIFTLLVFSIAITIIMIIHGIFFDLDISQIKRLTLEGLILTLIIVFPAILFLEWIFDLNNREVLKDIEKRLNKLERKK